MNVLSPAGFSVRVTPLGPDIHRRGDTVDCGPFGAGHADRTGDEPGRHRGLAGP